MTAAIRLAQSRCRVTVVEARDTPGGLAASIVLGQFSFDAGPYILLDRQGLEWAFAQLFLGIEQLSLRRIPDVYETNVNGQTLCVFDSLDKTAAEIERQWPGHGERYRSFIGKMQARYSRMQPLQCQTHPSLFDLLRSGAWRDVPFLLRSLGSVLNSSRLPPAVIESLGIWTHVAGQKRATAPSPLALVSAVIHGVGSYYPQAGIGSIPAMLYDAAKRLGVEFRLGSEVSRIDCAGHVVRGVELRNGETLEADAVVSNVGLGTYLKLLDAEGRDAIPGRVRRTLDRLPLQSPGVCVYLAVKGKVTPPYLRFHIRNEDDGCRLLVTPAVLDPSVTRDGWSPARLIAPLNHDRAESNGETGQQEFLSRVLAEDWWKNRFDDFRVLGTRIPKEWGAGYHLFRNSMNPVMTSRFMLAGRLAHRCPWIRRLYLTGSATHPGQWVSFCAVSGVLAADQVLLDSKK